jgi:hypothetical protein
MGYLQQTIMTAVCNGVSSQDGILAADENVSFVQWSKIFSMLSIIDGFFLLFELLFAAIFFIETLIV